MSGSTPHSHDANSGSKTELVFAILSGVFLISAWLVDVFDVAPFEVSLAGYLAGYFFGGWFALLEMLESLRQRRFQIDFLMLVAAAGAGVDGFFIEVHPDPANALSDATTQLDFDQFERLVPQLEAVDQVVRATAGESRR